MTYRIVLSFNKCIKLIWITQNYFNYYFLESIYIESPRILNNSFKNEAENEPTYLLAFGRGGVRLDFDRVEGGGCYFDKTKFICNYFKLFFSFLLFGGVNYFIYAHILSINTCL